MSRKPGAIQHTVKAACNREFNRLPEIEIGFDSESLSFDDLKSEKFWKDFTSIENHSARLDAKIWTNRGPLLLTFSYEHIALMLNDSLDIKNWEKSDARRLRENIDENNKKYNFYEVQI